MTYKILNISVLLGVSMLSAATSYKAVLSRGLEQPMQAQALATQPSKTAATPEDLLSKGRYPVEWNDYSINDMFGMLNKNPDENVDSVLLKEWICAIYACFNDFDKGNPKIKAINYTRTIHVLAKYTHGYKNQEIDSLPEIDTLIDALLAVWSQKAPVQQFEAQGIANSLWAFATLGKAAPDALLQAITDTNIHTFNAQGIANSLWAFATFCHNAPDALLQAITERNIHTFKAQEIASSLWAFAMRGQQAPDALLQSITKRNIHDFNAQGITKCLWAVATLGQEAPDALLQSITERNIHTFNAQNITSCLWAFATLGHKAPAVLLQGTRDANPIV